MKYSILTYFFFLIACRFVIGQNIEDPISYVQWKKVVLCNDAAFMTGKIDWGLGFLIKYKNDTIACTARDFTGTTYTRGKMLYVNNFAKEMKYWRMYVSDDPTQQVVLDTLFKKDKIEMKNSFFLYSAYFLTFSLKECNKNLIPLEPEIRRIPNRDTLYIVGYDKDHNIEIVRGIVETPLNEKYSDNEIRLKTDDFLYFSNFVGAPIVDKNGKVLGLVNRSYALYKNKKGRIINDNKEVAGASYEYFINGTSMRSILGKDYQK